MKLSLAAFTCLLTTVMISVAAQAPTNTDQLFTREDFEEDLYARDINAELLYHARRTLDHVRRLAHSHAELVARAGKERSDWPRVGNHGPLPKPLFYTQPQVDCIGKCHPGAPKAVYDACKAKCISDNPAPPPQPATATANQAHKRDLEWIY